MPSTNRLEIHKENLRRTANAGFLQYLENNHRETTAAAWEFGRITKVDGRKLSARSSWYFAVSADVYVVFSIDTALEGGRIKAREVLHEVWVRYRGSLATLNTIDYWYVTNAAARTATTNASFVLAQTQGNVLNIWNSIAVGAPGWSELGKFGFLHSTLLCFPTTPSPRSIRTFLEVMIH